MKKRMYRVLALIVLVSILSNGVIPAIAQDKDTSRVLFFTQNLDDVLQEYLSNNIQGILESILNVDGETDFKSVKVGNPLFVYGSDNVFCIPVFCGSGSTYILSLSSSAHGGIIVSYRLDEKQVLKNLPSGIYHLIKNDSTIYLVSENKCIELETDYSLYDKETETITTNECPYLDNKSRCVALTNDILQSYLEEAVCNNRAIIYKSLSVPLVSNYGSYCWAACSASICQYYGYYKTALDVHNFSHGYYHSLSNCTGGSISESYEAIHSFTGLSVLGSGEIDHSQVGKKQPISAGQI